MHPLRFVFLFLISPTRLVVEYLKRAGGEHGARVLVLWNLSFFFLELGVAVGLSIVTLLWHEWIVPLWLRSMFSYLALSRCNEVTLAFGLDAVRELEQREPNTTLSPGQRIKMAMRSYVGLLVNFGIICYFLPQCFYHPAFDTFVDAVYFSGVTLATLG